MLILWIVLGAVLATVIALNFLPGEKKVQTRISELYSIHDPQFLRSKGLPVPRWLDRTEHTQPDFAALEQS